MSAMSFVHNLLLKLIENMRNEHFSRGGSEAAAAARAAEPITPKSPETSPPSSAIFSTKECKSIFVASGSFVRRRRPMELQSN